MYIKLFGTSVVIMQILELKGKSTYLLSLGR